MEFLVLRGGEQRGPFTQDQIKEALENRSLREEDLIWYEGLAEWKRVDEIFEIEHIPLSATASPAPKVAAPVAPFSAEPLSSLPARTVVIKRKAAPAKTPLPKGTAPSGQGTASSSKPKPVETQQAAPEKRRPKWVLPLVLILVLAGLGVLFWPR